MAKRYISFRERLKGILKKRDAIDHLLDSMDLQIQHWDEKEFTVPDYLLDIYCKATNLTGEFDKILSGKTHKCSETRQKKAMIIGFDEIFDDLEKEMRDIIRSAAETWNQLNEESKKKSKEELAAAYDDFIKNVEIDD
jgi:hypothetical protein